MERFTVTKSNLGTLSVELILTNFFVFSDAQLIFVNNGERKTDSCIRKLIETLATRWPNI